ncbi:putative isotrichodermin C-15 hydroxylase [Rosellinia necatrix]|uniref:Putative isotrichodermin C-15 hydroxylase n=1 Tax=Rosellinia necatrix TaxID=77044 RepID=A0A1W2TR69_ROSNE|nr:putative isotrichodermin C-15 hydroxylase [Rosellinia necatrix]
MAGNVETVWTERLGIGQLALVAVVSALVWQTATIIYNIYFHPLRKFPGPLLQRASGLPWAIQHGIFGAQAHHTQRLHDQYGPVVRIGPNHISFTDPKAWKDIYGHRVGGDLHASEMSKSSQFVRVIPSIPTSIINADREEHGRFRRALSHGFSDASMRQQEPDIVKYVDLLIRRLHQECDNGNQQLNMEAWYNWTTFDVIGNLVFGESFKCLENADYHPWIEFIFKSVRGGALAVALTYVGLSGLVQILFRMGGLSISQIRKLTDEMLQKRLNLQKNHEDLFEGLVKRREEWDLSFQKLSSNAFILVLAGSETTATTLSGATYLLLTHPDILEKLKHEVRSAFQDSSQININTVNNLKYMLAILNESLRLYPPVTSGLVRSVPKGGAEIAGNFVTEGSMVEVQHWSMNHSKENWADPWEFKPERFLGTSAEALEAGNKLEALQAFNIGPRNCIGRNLAYAEMRLILARVIYDFDLRMADESKDWIERQKAYTLWDRVPLNVYLTPRVKA